MTGVVSTFTITGMLVADLTADSAGVFATGYASLLQAAAMSLFGDANLLPLFSPSRIVALDFSAGSSTSPPSLLVTLQVVVPSGNASSLDAVLAVVRMVAATPTQNTQSGVIVLVNGTGAVGSAALPAVLVPLAPPAVPPSMSGAAAAAVVLLLLPVLLILYLRSRGSVCGCTCTPVATLCGVLPLAPPRSVVITGGGVRGGGRGSASPRTTTTRNPLTVGGGKSGTSTPFERVGFRATPTPVRPPLVDGEGWGEEDEELVVAKADPVRRVVDPETGMLRELAPDWTRVADNSGDVWYVHSRTGEPSWDPVWKDEVA